MAPLGDVLVLSYENISIFLSLKSQNGRIKSAGVNLFFFI